LLGKILLVAVEAVLASEAVAVVVAHLEAVTSTSVVVEVVVLMEEVLVSLATDRKIYRKHGTALPTLLCYLQLEN
jgi:hypothetical protein